jgi:hypothetical protein
MDPIVAGEALHGGLDGSWTVEEGWDRVSLVLIRYFGDQSQAEANISVQLQVETPDFKIDATSLQGLRRQEFRVGETAYMKIEWSNAGKGRFHNYLEMDVHHADNMEDPVWVGVSVATLGNKESVRLIDANDALQGRWTLAGIKSADDSELAEIDTLLAAADLLDAISDPLLDPLAG